MLKRLLPVFCCCLFITRVGTALAAAPNWTVIDGTQYNHVVYGVIYLDGEILASPDSLLGAFGPGGESDCRGVAAVPFNENLSFYMTVVGSSNGESINFRLYESGADVVYKVDEVLVFQSDATNASYDLHSASPVGRGDLNYDHTSDLKDAVLAQQVLVGRPTAETVFKEAEVNGDGKIGLEEVAYILREVAKMNNGQ